LSAVGSYWLKLSPFGRVEEEAPPGAGESSPASPLGRHVAVERDGLPGVCGSQEVNAVSGRLSCLEHLVAAPVAHDGPGQAQGDGLGSNALRRQGDRECGHVLNHRRVEGDRGPGRAILEHAPDAEHPRARRGAVGGFHL